MRNKVFKNVCALALAATLMLGMGAAALAEDSSVGYEGGAEKFVFLPGSDWTASDLFTNFKGAMPGDTLTQNIKIKNDFAGCDYVSIYLRAEVHDASANPPSDAVASGINGHGPETAASMADFLSRLAMKVWNGTTLVYSGSPDAADGLLNNVLLGNFAYGASVTLTVELSVPSDLGNQYASRAGEVDWIFVAEEKNFEQHTGSLTIKNTVTGDLGDKTKDFAFTVVFGGQGEYPYTGSRSGTIQSGGTVLLHHGESITIAGLPSGAAYSVTESGNSGYRTYASGDTGLIPANAEATAAFTNSRRKVPPTGDDNQRLVGLIVMGVAGAGILALLLADRAARKKRDRLG